MKGKVLIISRYFPPGGGVGAFRAAKFVEYLPEFGWEPYVLSLPPETQDRFLPDGINKQQYQEIAEIPRERIYIDVPVQRIDKSLGDLRRAPLFAQQIPRIVREHDIDIVFHTAPPFYSLPNLLWTTQRIRSPYIIDLREPWYINRKMFKETKSVNNLAWVYVNRFLENITIDGSDKVILETDTMKELYKDKFKAQQYKFTSIMNGYDPKDYTTDQEAVPNQDRYQIIHPGKFRDNMQPFLQSIKKVNKYNDINILHFGDREYKYTKKVYDQAKKMGVEGLIEMKGYAEFEEIIANIRQSDVGLVVARRNDPTHIPQKAFDYIACNIPVLALGPEGGELNKMIQPFENGYCMEHEDHQEITKTLRYLIEENPTILGAEKKRREHTRERRTEELSILFDSVL